MRELVGRQKRLRSVMQCSDQKKSSSRVARVLLPIVVLMATICCPTPSKRTVHRKRLRSMHKDRLQKALFMVVLQLQGMRSNVADLPDKVVMQEPCPREQLLEEYRPLKLESRGFPPQSLNPEAEELVPSLQCQLDEVLDFVDRRSKQR